MRELDCQLRNRGTKKLELLFLLNHSFSGEWFVEVFIYFWWIDWSWRTRFRVGLGKAKEHHQIFLAVGTGMSHILWALAEFLVAKCTYIFLFCFRRILLVTAIHCISNNTDVMITYHHFMQVNRKCYCCHVSCRFW